MYPFSFQVEKAQTKKVVNFTQKSSPIFLKEDSRKYLLNIQNFEQATSIMILVESVETKQDNYSQEIFTTQAAYDTKGNPL